MGSSSFKRSRATSGGKAAAATNRWYYLRRVIGEDEDGMELLECGHSMRPRSDMIGTYYAERRRCRECPKPTEPCPTCEGTGAVPGPTVPLRCPDCDSGVRLISR